MKTAALKTCVVLASLVAGLSALSACDRAPSGNDGKSSLASDGRRVGQFKGYMAISEELRQRLIASDQSWHLSRYLGANPMAPDTLSGLPALLGGYSGQNGNSQFRNGSPNAMNMLLWQMSLGLTGTDVAKNCTSPLPEGAAPISADFSTRLKALCTWPAADAKTEANLMALWTSVVGYAAPQAEFTAWRDYFLSATSPYATATGAQAVDAMMASMLLNPYFLLER